MWVRVWGGLQLVGCVPWSNFMQQHNASQLGGVAAAHECMMGRGRTGSAGFRHRLGGQAWGSATGWVDRASSGR